MREAGGTLTSHPLRPAPDDRSRPWAGHRLGSIEDRVGERWLAGPDSVVDTGAGPATLDDIAREAGEALIGARGLARVGFRFPLLAKLIDADDWLSLQVHPDDTLAVELRGPGQFGKSEAWVILDSTPDAELVTGPRPGLGSDRLLAAVAAGELDLDDCMRHPAIPGDTWLLVPGTLHAIGAGSFIYEIEQPSDITFRVSDWGRPASPERPLHRAESARAVDPAAVASLVGRSWRLDGGTLVTPDYQLELINLPGEVARHPGGGSVEVVTAITGGVTVSDDGWVEELDALETIVIPAAVPRYAISGAGDGLDCIATVS